MSELPIDSERKSAFSYIFSKIFNINRKALISKKKNTRVIIISEIKGFC